MGEKMNWKQKLVLWVAVISISLVFLLNEPMYKHYWSYVLRGVIPILLLTTLLFITFKK